jgi:hypothetical protein
MLLGGTSLNVTPATLRQKDYVCMYADAQIARAAKR